MLVNESTLRAVVRKYLLKEITMDSAASVHNDIATTAVPFVGPFVNFSVGAMTRRSARRNFMVVNPLGGENSPSAMTQNATDRGITPQQQIEHLYNYVNNNNINAVYLAIIKILKNHAGDLDAEENEIEKLYGKALFTSLINAAGSSFTSAQPLPKETAALLSLPITPAGLNDLATVAQLTAQRDKALAQANKFDTTGPGTTPTAAPAAAPAARAPAPAAKPKPAGDWDSYVRMTIDGAAVKSAWEAYAATRKVKPDYYSFVNWYRNQMKSNSGRHLSPKAIIGRLQQTTPRDSVAPSPAAAQTPQPS